MTVKMAYLLGMVVGNGTVRRGPTETTIAIDIPHKKLTTESNNDVRVYVRASIADIRNNLEPLIGTGIQFVQNDKSTLLSFSKPNADYLIQEILRYIGNAQSHENIRIDSDVFTFSRDERLHFLRGLVDVTGYIRRSNYYIAKYNHRVYIEIPHNWGLVVDVCNLLKSVDIPVQSIDWAHPNMRDPRLVRYNRGQENFWKKEHQIKIYANEFRPVGFAVIHKSEALDALARELEEGISETGRIPREVTHRFYWELGASLKIKPPHPAEDDPAIPDVIRGRHYNSWREIARDLGYGR